LVEVASLEGSASDVAVSFCGDSCWVYWGGSSTDLGVAEFFDPADIAFALGYGE
jgi:hypothetical protein